MACYVPFCESTLPYKKGDKREPDVSFHRFPADSELRKKWIVAIGKKDPKTGAYWDPFKSALVCSLHFSPGQFHPSKKHLKSGSIPFIFPDYNLPQRGALLDEMDLSSMKLIPSPNNRETANISKKSNHVIGQSSYVHRDLMVDDVVPNEKDFRNTKTKLTLVEIKLTPLKVISSPSDIDPKNTLKQSNDVARQSSDVHRNTFVYNAPSNIKTFRNTETKQTQHQIDLSSSKIISSSSNNQSKNTSEQSNSVTGQSAGLHRYLCVGNAHSNAENFRNIKTKQQIDLTPIKIIPSSNNNGSENASGQSNSVIRQSSDLQRGIFVSTAHSNTKNFKNTKTKQTLHKINSSSNKIISSSSNINPESTSEQSHSVIKQSSGLYRNLVVDALSSANDFKNTNTKRTFSEMNSSQTNNVKIVNKQPKLNLQKIQLIPVNKIQLPTTSQPVNRSSTEALPVPKISSFTSLNPNFISIIQSIQKNCTKTNANSS